MNEYFAEAMEKLWREQWQRHDKAWTCHDFWAQIATVALLDDLNSHGCDMTLWDTE